MHDVSVLSPVSASGIEGAKGLGIEPIVSADDINQESSEHLGIMAYSARFLNLNPGTVQYEHSYKVRKVIEKQ